VLPVVAGANGVAAFWPFFERPCRAFPGLPPGFNFSTDAPQRIVTPDSACHICFTIFTPSLIRPPELRLQQELSCSPLFQQSHRATCRYVLSEATAVSIFLFNESVVDTSRLFGVNSASSLAMGALRVVNHRFSSRSSVCFCLLQTGLPLAA